jgi:hypothetical protein
MLCSSEKQRRTASLFAVSFTLQIISGPGFPQRTRCRSLLICWQNSENSESVPHRDNIGRSLWGRVLLGLGMSHQPVNAALGVDMTSPITAKGQKPLGELRAIRRIDDLAVADAVG